MMLATDCAEQIGLVPSAVLLGDLAWRCWVTVWLGAAVVRVSVPSVFMPKNSKATMARRANGAKGGKITNENAVKGEGGVNVPSLGGCMALS